jgi:hypothetical protein
MQQNSVYRCAVNEQLLWYVLVCYRRSGSGRAATGSEPRRRGNVFWRLNSAGSTQRAERSVKRLMDLVEPLWRCFFSARHGSGLQKLDRPGPIIFGQYRKGFNA